MATGNLDNEFFVDGYVPLPLVWKATFFAWAANQDKSGFNAKYIIMTI